MGPTAKVPGVASGEKGRDDPAAPRSLYAETGAGDRDRSSAAAAVSSSRTSPNAPPNSHSASSSLPSFGPASLASLAQTPMASSHMSALALKLQGLLPDSSLLSGSVINSSVPNGSGRHDGSAPNGSQGVLQGLAGVGGAPIVGSASGLSTKYLEALGYARMAESGGVFGSLGASAGLGTTAGGGLGQLSLPSLPLQSLPHSLPLQASLQAQQLNLLQQQLLAHHQGQQQHGHSQAAEQQHQLLLQLAVGQLAAERDAIQRREAGLSIAPSASASGSKLTMASLSAPAPIALPHPPPAAAAAAEGRASDALGSTLLSAGLQLQRRAGKRALEASSMGAGPSDAHGQAATLAFAFGGRPSAADSGAGQRFSGAGLGRTSSGGESHSGMETGSPGAKDRGMEGGGKRARQEGNGGEEGDVGLYEDGEGEGEDEDGSGGRGGKKMKLSKEEVVLLEEAFRKHPRPSLRQKEGIARKLNVRMRQVEVWFQNRRARTKIKATEAELEHLRRRCRELEAKNESLQKELQSTRTGQCAKCSCES